MKSEALPPPAIPDPAYLVLTEDAEGMRRGMLIPNAPELAKTFAGKTRPATQADIDVSAVAYLNPAVSA